MLVCLISIFNLLADTLHFLTFAHFSYNTKSRDKSHGCPPTIKTLRNQDLDRVGVKIRVRIKILGVFLVRIFCCFLHEFFVGLFPPATPFECLIFIGFFCLVSIFLFFGMFALPVFAYFLGK